MGIAIRNATASDAEPVSVNLAAGIRQDASGLLGTTVMLGDLVGFSGLVYCQSDG